MSISSVFDAIRKNDREAFIAAIDSCDALADIDQVNESRYANWFSGIGMTLLQLTSFVRSELAAPLLQRGATIDLHSACALGDLDAIRRILERDPDAIDQQIDSYYPIQFALQHPDALRLLLENGDDANRPLKKVAWFDWEDPAAERGLSDWRLIHMVALGRGNAPQDQVGPVLKDFGCDLKVASSPFGESAIHLAAIYGRDRFIRWLVSQGIDVDSPTEDRDNAQEAARGLFDTGPFAPFDSHSKTPLMIALGEGQSAAIHCLLELGADVGATDSAGFSPLHYAAGAYWQENLDSVDRLLQQGSDVNAVADAGLTPIDLARSKGYAAITKLLADQRP